MYWLSSSLISMGQISLLKLRSFRSLMGIPDLIIHENIKDDGKGFIATLKSGESGLVILSHVHYVQVLGVYRLTISTIVCHTFVVVHTKTARFGDVGILASEFDMLLSFSSRC